jgi:hypothetical protein
MQNSQRLEVPTKPYAAYRAERFSLEDERTAHFAKGDTKAI